jgi:monoterpene epsilon-lactone hydrolase
MPSWQNEALALVLRLRGVKRSLATAEAVRRAQRASALRPARYAPPKSLDRTVDLSVDTVAAWPVYTVTPRAGSATRHVLYLHGGGYVAEVTSAHWKLVAQLAAQASADVVLPIYPLAPASTAAQTVARAAALLTTMIDTHGAEHVVVIGDSAGGAIAVAVAEQLRDEGKAQPARIVLISPWLDVTMSDPRQAEIDPTDPILARPGLAELGRLYAGDLNVTDYRVSPLHGDLAGLAPITVFAGTREILHADARALVDKAKQAGVPVEFHEGSGLFHGYPLLPTPEGTAARRVIVRTVAQKPMRRARSVMARSK